ncbi:type 11 methyltransferase [Shewanella sp. NFH-SH190041]|uniref:class I SAM-dependent methyltransferase n=1 Tax=Shewanella sp. NFH-SH190041 TaxID=2950245 RepID=UPI0021C2B284|nr:class I SAM-dependent methyltransferase [Shewanella sp. NFH-SH190041]BDM64070.1 type 11 methyltransferase [Shewanella sp. NFH-SH190041]
MPHFQRSPLPISPAHWQDFPNGEHIKQQVELAMAPWWPRIFGYHLLKLGPLSAEVDSQACTILHQFSVFDTQGAALRGDIAQLPLQHASVDAVLANFVLEFEANPYQVLREVDRVLISGGQLILTGFNPLSMAFAGKLLPRYQGCLPWCGHFFLPSRVKDWLALLGYQVICDERLLYHPLFGAMDNATRWQQALASWLPGAGSLYLIIARKLESPLTPIREKHKVRRPRWQTVPSAGRVQSDTPSGAELKRQ